MEPHEALEQHEHIKEAGHRFAVPAAILVAILAAVLAVATVSANSAMTHTILDQGKANDAWQEYASNSFKKHLNENNAALLRLLATGTKRKEALALASSLEHVAKTKYTPNQDRLLPKALEFEKSRDKSEDRHRILEFAEADLQLAIVLCSIAVVIGIQALLVAGGLVGALGVLLTIDGLLVLVKITA